MSDYREEALREQSRQEVWRKITFATWIIILSALGWLFGDALIEYGRSTASVQASSPIYKIEVEPTSQPTIQPTAVPTVPSLQQGTTVNKPGKP